LGIHLTEDLKSSTWCYRPAAKARSVMEMDKILCPGMVTALRKRYRVLEQ